MYRIALGLEYDGATFSGWQAQSSPQLETVQENLEAALSRIAAHPIKTICAGRTDAGVHATNQVVHFDSPVNRGKKHGRRALTVFCRHQFVLFGLKMSIAGFTPGLVLWLAIINT